MTIATFASRSCPTRTTAAGSWYITNGVCVDVAEILVNGRSIPLPRLFLGKDDSGETFAFILTSDTEGRDVESGVLLKTHGNETRPQSLEMWMAGIECACISLDPAYQPKCPHPGVLW